MAVLSTQRRWTRRMHDALTLAREHGREPAGFWLTYDERAALKKEAALLGVAEDGMKLSLRGGPLAILVEAQGETAGRVCYGTADMIGDYGGVPIYVTDKKFIPQPSKTPDGDAIAV